MITNLEIGYNGRFGNQIFQFAALLGIAKKNGYDAKIPISNLVNHRIQRTMDGVSFNARFELTDIFDIDNSVFTDNISIFQQKIEDHFHFQDDFFQIDDFTNIHGYFQTQRYFEHCDDLIRKNLTIKKEILDKAKEFLPKTDKEIVSIHIRRGDYTHPNPFHPVNGEEYVNLALNTFSENEKYHFLVISDDKDWCKKVWSNKKDFTISESDNHFIDFSMMTLCDHHIISNSSFSWWASYLSSNSDKKIVAPKNWFGPGLSQHNTKDLYTKNMIVI